MKWRFQTIISAPSFGFREYISKLPRGSQIYGAQEKQIHSNNNEKFVYSSAALDDAIVCTNMSGW